ncbi:hypothetical protein KP509_06G003300 [Ceratopteris richardii]|uniref:Enkurin domain-containing protein n=1 Tax=Ceratopteris richardii TaxID=49495 RepID=A0A8T2UHM3_CERRI|nr:hypothetical protein KP509_06G003300 [Ceratopteris richardii]
MTDEERRELDNYAKDLQWQNRHSSSAEPKRHDFELENDKRLAEQEKSKSVNDSIDHTLSRFERRAKTQASVEMEGVILPKFKCRWAPLPSHIDSSQVCQLLCPPPGIREIMLRKGITPRNHCKENRVAIAQKSALNHAAKQASLSKAPCPPVKSIPEKKPIPKPKEHSVNFVMKNMMDAGHVPLRRTNKGIGPDSQKIRENFGKIPSYLIRRKIELAQEMEKRMNEGKNNELPPGYVEMSEAEKNEVLTALKENKAVLEKKLGSMPLVCDTPSQIRAKSNIDSEIRDIENAVKRFSRPHVYISLND